MTEFDRISFFGCLFVFFLLFSAPPPVKLCPPPFFYEVCHVTKGGEFYARSRDTKPLFFPPKRDNFDIIFEVTLTPATTTTSAHVATPSLVPRPLNLPHTLPRGSFSAAAGRHCSSEGRPGTAQLEIALHDFPCSLAS